MTARGLWGYALVNPSTVLNGPKSLLVASLGQAMDVFHSVMDEIAQIVEVITPRMATRLSRVDVTRTVEIAGNSQGVLALVAGCPYNPRLKTVTYTGTRGAESVTCRTKKSGGFLIYDKSRQMRAKGTAIRFEVEARRKFLKKKCPTIGDLSEDRCRMIFDHFLGKVIDALRIIVRTDVDNILANEKDTKTFMTSIGLSVLKDKGYTPAMSDYWCIRVYRPFKNKYPHNTIGEFFAQ